MIRSYMLFDVETVRHPAAPPPPDPEKCPPPAFHQIAAAACAHLVFRSEDSVSPERPNVSLYGPSLCPGQTEPEIIESFLARRHDDDILTGWNIRGFDIPVMHMAAMEHGMRVEELHQRGVVDRYRGSLDLQDSLTMYGAALKSGLDAVTKRLGWPGKVCGHGGDVEAMLADGEAGRARVERYLLQDVILVGAALVPYLFSIGAISVEQRQAALQLLVTTVDTHPLLSEQRAMNRELVLAPPRVRAPRAPA